MSHYFLDLLLNLLTIFTVDEPSCDDIIIIYPMLKYIVLKEKAIVRRVAKWCSTGLPPREKMSYDVAIVGGGIAGLSTAIRLKQ